MIDMFEEKREHVANRDNGNNGQVQEMLRNQQTFVERRRSWGRWSNEGHPPRASKQGSTTHMRETLLIPVRYHVENETHGLHTDS